MRRPISLALMAVTAAGLAGCGSSMRTIDLKVQSDPRIERQAVERYRGIVDRLQPPARDKLNRATRAFAARIGQCPDAEDAAVVARQEVERAFEGQTEAQTDMLMLGVVAGLVDAMKGRHDQLGDLDEMTSMRLQMAMDRRSRFMSAVSNIMKKMADTNSAIVQNLK